MPDDFGNRIRDIGDAYVEQVKAGQAFFAGWTKISNDVVRPVFLEARNEIKSVGLSIKDENGEITLELIIAPIGKNPKKTLSYRPNRRERFIVLKTDLGDENKREEIQIEDISTDLVEIHVESFLKSALRLKA